MGLKSKYFDPCPARSNMSKFNIGDIVMAKAGDLLNKDAYVVGTIIDKRDNGLSSYKIEWSDGDIDIYTEESVIRYKEILETYKRK